MSNINFRFFTIFLLVLSTLLFPLSGQGTGKTLALTDIDGAWSINVDKSRTTVTSAANFLEEYRGFSFTLSAKNKTIRMEWPGFDPKTHKLTVTKATTTEVHCKLDGFDQPMIIEPSGPDEIFVKDRDETLVFNRIKK